jgi:hypothetical protein
VIREDWRSSGVSCWHTGWQKVGWLEQWMVVAGADWESGWEAAGHGDPRNREPKVRRGLVGTLGGQNQHNYQEGITYPYWNRE